MTTNTARDGEYLRLIRLHSFRPGIGGEGGKDRQPDTQRGKQRER